MKRLNIAYGSNLNLDQMAHRCPTAKVYGKGMLEGYRLLFKGTTENAYLTIEPHNGGKVPVLIWELQPEDEKALDFYEGYPNFYCIVTKEVLLENEAFQEFASDFLEDQPWITKEDGGVNEKGEIRCIRVISKDSGEKILVNSEGYDYPRYTAIENN